MSVARRLARIIALAGACVLASLAPLDASAEPIAIRARAVMLDTEAEAETSAQTRVGELEFLAGFVLTSDDGRFGGLSGLSIADDGRSIVAVSDHGWWLKAELGLTADGRLTGIGSAELFPIRRPDGGPVRIDDGDHDAEAVERLPGGGLIVSFERRHRLWRYASTAAPAVPLADFPALERLPLNGGIEAIAPLGAGRLLMLSEEGEDERGGFKGWLWRDGRIDAVRYVAVGAFKPTDLARLPGGDLLVLERRYSLLGGAGARLARIARETVRPGARLEGGEIARLEWPLLTENFEGLAVVPAAEGDAYVYLLSDDNFNPLQDTLLLQFRLPRRGPG